MDSDSDDVDGVPLDGAALLRSAVKLQSEGGVATPPATPATAARSLKARADPDDDDDDDVDGVPSESFGLFFRQRTEPSLMKTF